MTKPYTITTADRLHVFVATPDYLALHTKQLLLENMVLEIGKTLLRVTKVLVMQDSKYYKRQNYYELTFEKI